MTERFRVPAVDDPDFVVDFSYAEAISDGAVLRLSGSAEGGATEGFAAVLQTVHRELRERATPAVVVDLRAVDRMAPACFNELVAWISRLHELAPRDRYQIRVRVNAAIRWQQHGVDTLRCFDTDIIRIES